MRERQYETEGCVVKEEKVGREEKMLEETLTTLKPSWACRLRCLLGQYGWTGTTGCRWAMGSKEEGQPVI
jgi:hypothetical protein